MSASCSLFRILSPILEHSLSLSEPLASSSSTRSLSRSSRLLSDTRSLYLDRSSRIPPLVPILEFLILFLTPNTLARTAKIAHKILNKISISKLSSYVNISHFPAYTQLYLQPLRLERMLQFQ